MNEIISAGLLLYRRVFGVILGLVLTIALPCQMLLGYLEYHVIGKENLLLLWQAAITLESVFGIVLTGGVLHALFVERLQRRATFPECLSTGINYWLRLAWTNFLVVACVILGTLLLIIPGIFFAVRLSLALTVVMTEDEWGLSALQRSMRLTADRGWSVIGLGVLLYLPIMILGQLGVAMLMTVPALDQWLVVAGLGTFIHLFGCLIPVCFFVLYEKLAQEDVREE